MIGSKFWTLPSKSVPDRPSIPDGVRVYAVGDVHGRLDLLDRLLDQIEREVEEARPERTVLVFLGDLIDRGPDSCAVIERVRTYRHAGVRPVFLMGNHEEVFQKVLAGDERLTGDWLRFGGFECALSYGVDSRLLKSGRRAAIVEALRNTVPQAHVDFIGSFVDSFRVGDYFLVHAGIRPEIPIDQQMQHDLRWIRSPFLEYSDRHPLMVVHGHTITPQVDERPGRIGIDTGAYRSGCLSALVMERQRRWIVDARSTSAEDVSGMVET